MERHNVDMENQATIDEWTTKVLFAIADVPVDKTEDYLPQSLTTEELHASYHRNKPFYATILVCPTATTMIVVCLTRIYIYFLIPLKDDIFTEFNLCYYADCQTSLPKATSSLQYYLYVYTCTYKCTCKYVNM